MHNWFRMHCIYFNEHYKKIVRDLRKHQAIDADPKAIQQINFTGNLEQKATIFFITEEAKRNCFRFFTMNCKSILILFFTYYKMTQ